MNMNTKVLFVASLIVIFMAAINPLPAYADGDTPPPPPPEERCGAFCDGLAIACSTGCALAGKNFTHVCKIKTETGKDDECLGGECECTTPLDVGGDQQ